MEQSTTNLSNSQFLAQNSLQLLEALAGESGLQHIVELGYAMFGNPVLLIDTSLKTIAFSNTEVKDDPVWNEYVTSGYASLSSVNYYTSNKLTLLVNQSEVPFFWTDPYSKYPRIMSKVVIGGKQIALLSIIAHEKPFQNTDLELAILLSKAIAIELQKNKFIHYSRGVMHENFIEELLTGKTKDGKIIQERIKVLNIRFSKNLYTLALDISRFDNSKTSLAYLRNELENQIPKSKAVIYEDKIVLIISYDDHDQFYKSEINKLKMFLKTYHIYAGMSRCFHNLEEVQEHYFQSLDALRLGMLLNEEDYFHPYEEYAIYHFAESSGVENLRKNCHPSLWKLIEYDGENNTDYTRSLYTFIIHSKNITESAKASNIHRNTMFYRLEKIESIMNIDINNSNTFLHLHLSFKILELLKIDLP
ncbi:helix-turn-helix domain-containing protein [Desulfosporosinus sp. BG]|uniref:PucR family transcriptional regulator n=1 Tax=Desulfosporosinus sp. BG TaxID=1633135 RepID=UPI00083B116A|nr:helix-turn-helix domain-containing protein [Desulfosporosinus sp. BG]ODA42569.1 Regulator of polyketide synthase expression [Desulfosporosinus sp. BG]